MTVNYNNCDTQISTEQDHIETGFRFFLTNFYFLSKTQKSLYKCDKLPAAGQLQYVCQF